MYLLDTMVVSEQTRPRPEQRVLLWMSQQSADDIFISALSIGEIVFGIRRLPQSQRRSRLEAWMEQDFRPFFEGRILNVDERVSRAWAFLREAGQRSPPPLESLIAATALAHDLTLITRNLGDFERSGVRIYNPWA